MAYRRSYRSNDWHSWHGSQLQRQSQEMGGIDVDVRTAFLAFTDSELHDFFFHYERQYGSSARAYAEKAFRRWKTGTTRMSAQTTERLLQVLPPFLGTAVKYDLLRKLREKYRQPEKHSVEVTLHNYRQVIDPLVERIIAKAYSANLPPTLEQRLGWLSHSDAVVAKSLMQGAEASAMKATLSLLDEELVQIRRLLDATPKGTITHRIELPYGMITLTVKRGKPMENKSSSDLVKGRTIDSTAITTSDQLLKNAIRNLTEEQMNEVSMKATQEALNLHAESTRADQRFQNAARDVDLFVENAERLNRMDANYKTSGSFNTASGTTSVNVERNSSRVWIIAVIALAVLVFLLIMKR